jgi:acyl-CoA thioesterase-1
MRRFRDTTSIAAFLIVAGALVSLEGCRGGTPEAANPYIATTNHAPADTRPIVACFGDSLTAGYGADDGQSYPDFLQKDLDADGFHYRVVNEGISGNTTKDGVDRLSEVTDLHPEVVVLEFGGNDGLRGLKVETTRANLSHMIEALKESGAKVVLAGITLPPDYGPDYVNAFTRNYSVLAKQYNLPVLPFLLEHVYGVPGLMQADNTHATDKGNAVVARNVLPYVEPLLKK